MCCVNLYFITVVLIRLYLCMLEIYQYIASEQPEAVVRLEDLLEVKVGNKGVLTYI